MGWSCTAAASRTMERLADACAKHRHGSSNTYDHEGETYCWETSRTEHDDGAVTGRVWRMVGPERARPIGSFRIEADGTLSRGAGGLRTLLQEV